MLRTDRLILRQWSEDDFRPFSMMCSDAEVMEFFPKPLSEEESFQMGEKIRSLIEQRGWGFWAVEIPNRENFIGFVGLHLLEDSMPFSPCVEIGWRLAKKHWGKGYATEAANESLKYAFTDLGLTEVVSFTTLGNIRSQTVMKKIGMSQVGNFMHPDIDVTHPLREHVLYRITKDQWER